MLNEYSHSLISKQVYHSKSVLGNRSLTSVNTVEGSTFSMTAVFHSRAMKGY